MAAEVRQFPVTTAAGVAIATPTITSLAMPARIVTGLRIRIPPGPRGNLGLQVAMAGTQVIPVNVGTWIVGDDELFHFDLEDLPDSGAWQLITYNLGKLPHTVYLTFELSLVGTPAGPVLLAPATVTA